MKNIVRIPFLFTTAVALTTGFAKASDDFAAGDLALVFYSTGTDPGSSIANEYYVFNLGAAASFRENTLTNVPVKTVNNSIASSNIATDLENVFGPTWAEDGLVRMMAVSTIRQEGVLTNGDPTRTIYYSVPRTSLNTADKGADPTTVFPFLDDVDRIPTSNDIRSFLYIGTNGSIPGATSGVNLSGVRLTKSGAANNLSLYIPPDSGGTYFQSGVDPRATLDVGVLPGTAGVEAAVDIFRVLHSTTNADLTSGSSSGNAVIGEGQFIGSITLDSSGNLKVQAVGLPTSSNYYSYATANGLTGGPNADTDKDGINNLTEYALNTNLNGSDGSVGTLSGGVLSFTKRAAAVTNGDLTYSIEISTDLGISNPWTPLGGVTNDSTTISGTLPPGLPKQFARLKILSSAVAP